MNPSDFLYLGRLNYCFKMTLMLNKCQIIEPKQVFFKCRNNLELARKPKMVCAKSFNIVRVLVCAHN